MEHPELLKAQEILREDGHGCYLAGKLRLSNARAQARFSPPHPSAIPGALKQSSRFWSAAVRARFDHSWTGRERYKLLWRTDSHFSPFRDLSAARQHQVAILDRELLAYTVHALHCKIVC